MTNVRAYRMDISIDTNIIGMSGHIDLSGGWEFVNGGILIIGHYYI